MVSKVQFIGGEKRVVKDLEQAHFAVGFEAPSLKVLNFSLVKFFQL